MLFDDTLLTFSATEVVRGQLLKFNHVMNSEFVIFFHCKQHLCGCKYVGYCRHCWCVIMHYVCYRLAAATICMVMNLIFNFQRSQLHISGNECSLVYSKLANHCVVHCATCIMPYAVHAIDPCWVLPAILNVFKCNSNISSNVVHE